MEPLESSSTQSSAQHQNILVDAEGKPLKINLQAVELEGRPKLVRALKTSGALVTSNAKEAAIILVDSATESGKRLIRTWGRDASKVVLEHTWVRTSMSVGRPLFEADNWGGEMAIDDGQPVTIDGVVMDEDELEEVEALTKSPLPTPRVTPEDPASQRSEITAEHSNVNRLESEPHTSTPDATRLPAPAPPIVQPPVVGPTLSEEVEMNMSPHNDIQRPRSPPLLPATQPLSYLQPTLSVQSPQSRNPHVYAPSAVQQPYPSSQSQMMPTQPFLHTSFSSSQQAIAPTPSLPHTPLPSAQPQMMQVTSNMGGINGVNPQNSNFATLMTIMDVMRHMDQSSWFGQSPLPMSQYLHPPTNSTISTFSGQPPATSGVDTSLSSSQDRLSDAAASSLKHDSGTEASEDSMVRRSRIKPSRRPLDEASTPSTSRKRSSVIKPASPPSKRLRRGKERAISSCSSEHSEVDEHMGVSDDLYLTHSSSSPLERPRNIIAHKKYGEIFMSESGQPLRFFVQVDLHGRHAVVTNIKKNMGKIVNNIADSDYLILSPRSDTFQGLLNEATALGKSPILATFVADCVEEGVLLDETEYILGSVAKVRALKRGRQNAFSIKVETSETLAHQIKVAKTKTSPAAGEGKKSKGTPSKALTDNIPKKVLNSTSSKPTIEGGKDPMRSRSPTPPPASTHRLMRVGKYLFTQVEDEYVLRLAKHHLNRDPTISNTALVGKLHRKMPHHTAISWASHIDQKLKSAIEDIRKWANITKRKHDSETASRILSQGLVGTCTPSGGCISSVDEGNGNIPIQSGQPSQENLERQDFEVITQFFASGGGDDDDDERVWQELEKHCPCRSATSWPEYYAARQKEVYSRIEELMNERAGG